MEGVSWHQHPSFQAVEREAAVLINVLENTFKHTPITPQAIPPGFPGDKLEHREERNSEEEAERKLYLYESFKTLTGTFVGLFKVIYLICIIILSNFSENYHIYQDIFRQ